jgi:type I restriction enzyme M protein
MTQITTNIKGIRDIMRKDTGVDGDAQRISQMVWMLFMKIFADKEEEWEITIEGYESPIPEKLKWQSWAADEEGLTGDALMDFVNNELFPSLKELDFSISPQAKIIRAVFEDTYNYMKNGTLFRQVINQINGIDFNSSTERHLFNDLYETILKELQSAGSSGEYYTPRAVTQFMVDIIDPKLQESVLDPACGTGGFLTCTIDHKKELVQNDKDERHLQATIRGIEKKPLPHLLCTTNLMLHGFDVPAVRRDNMLSKPYADWGASDKVDIILTNPPFGGVEEDGTETNFPQKFRTKETADLFLALIIRLLKAGGRCAVVLPDGTLFGEGVKTRIKEELMARCNLHTIVRLPNGVFNPYTGIKTNILFFEKQSNNRPQSGAEGGATKDIWYFEHPYPAGVKSYNKGKPINIKEFDLEKAWWTDRDNEKYSRHAWKVSAEEIKARGYNLDIKNPHQESDDLASPEELLSQFNTTENNISRIQAEIIKVLSDALN